MWRLLVMFLLVGVCFAHFVEIAPAFGVANGQIRFMNFAKTDGYLLVGHVLETFQVQNYVDCAFKCLLNSTCFSFNYGGTKTNGLYTCELNNSDKFVHPHNFTTKQGYVYSGVNAPCFSNPCANGGRCTESKDSFTCSCLLSIRDLPYIDARCNVDNKLIKKTDSYAGVTGVKVAGHYKLTFYEAGRLCEILGAGLASYNQVYKAWEAGMQWCSFGWMKDGKAGYPMQTVVYGCGNRKGVITLTPASKNNRYNTLCYKP